MQEQKREVKMPHTVSIDNRQRMTLTGVSQVETFDEETVILATDLGKLTIKGEGLKILGLDVDSGRCDVSGHIDGMAYSEDRSGGFMRRLFR